MSEIPVVNLLGDELERAAARAAAPRRSRGRRRLGMLAVAGALLASGTALAAGLLGGDVEDQATAAIACYDGADRSFARSVALVPREAGSSRPSPVTLCRRALAGGSGPVPPLVACAHEGLVSVIPGRSRRDCAEAGFAPLDPAYAGARRRVARLEHAFLAIEASADCIAPRRLAALVQRRFERLGWSGWTARVNPRGTGPCASVSHFGGDGRRYIHFDQAARTVQVSRTGPRRVEDLLYSADRSLLPVLFDASGARCFSLAGLRARVERTFAAHGLTARVEPARVPRGSALDDDDGRWTRYTAGCAVVAGGAPGPERASVTIEVFVR
jgi:hypothetical protein